MVNTSQKTPLANSLNLLAQQQALNVIAQLGKALPATVTAVAGSIVTVSFNIQSGYTLPNVTCPVACSQWIREPVQVGDQGVVEPADAALGGVSGLGGGTATLSPVGNLSALIWKPVANQSWTMPDAGKPFINGPTGFICGDKNQVVEIVGDSTARTITFKIGGAAVLTVNATGVIDNGNLQISGAIENATGGIYAGDIKTAGNVIGGFGTGDQVGLTTHTHTQPNDSHGDTEQPTSAPTAGT